MGVAWAHERRGRIVCMSAWEWLGVHGCMGVAWGAWAHRVHGLTFCGSVPRGRAEGLPSVPGLILRDLTMPVRFPDSFLHGG